MHEARRQACLQALGLTPWVARAPLPGAAASARLETPAPAAEVPQPAPEPEAETRTPVPETPAPESGPPPQAREATESTQTSRPETGPRFTLHALATPSLLLMVQQTDPDAPEPGRDEQRLLAALLRYFNAGEARPRTFAWPLPGADNEAEQARASLEAFTGRLCSDHRLPRVLWLVDEPLTQTLLGQSRFARFAWRELDCLAVAGLNEMLTDPVTHKRASWQAMVRYGFIL